MLAFHEGGSEFEISYHLFQNEFGKYIIIMVVAIYRKIKIKM